ncbi:MAG: hypothetical protein M3Y51_03880 [Actinomycetota bacterium]|nr:hypothetical protein [Actinomycetota bacterium]
MPEGDTIHNLATRLRPALAGEVLERFEAPHLSGDRPRAGERIEVVEAVGKHLLIRFSGGLTLNTHLRMNGSWHLYPVGRRWREPPHLMRCYIGVHDWQAVCFAAPLVRTFPTRRSGTPLDPLAHLGPDLCLEHPGGNAVDSEVVARCIGRMDELEIDPSTPIGEVLLDQRVGNGIGNVYKSDVCWIERVNPFDPLAAVDRDTRARLISTASRLLHVNLRPGRRRTVPGGLAVYGRRGKPCRRCGTAVRVAKEGDLERITYWCPTCQQPRSVEGQGSVRVRPDA